VLIAKDVVVKMYYPGFKGKKLMMEAKVRGTTFTGHPTSTTLGNTFRMLFYTLFIKDEAKITTLENFHAGDDVLTIINKIDCIRF
jgi:hypothetical protein